MNTLHIKIKNNYGNEAIYPACDNARAFAKIAGTTTLTRAVIAHIKSLGFSIVNDSEMVVI